MEEDNRKRHSLADFDRVAIQSDDSDCNYESERMSRAIVSEGQRTEFAMLCSNYNNHYERADREELEHR